MINILLSVYFDLFSVVIIADMEVAKRSINYLTEQLFCLFMFCWANTELEQCEWWLVVVAGEYAAVRCGDIVFTMFITINTPLAFIYNN